MLLTKMLKMQVYMATGKPLVTLIKAVSVSEWETEKMGGDLQAVNLDNSFEEFCWEEGN